MKVTQEGKEVTVAACAWWCRQCDAEYLVPYYDLSIRTADYETRVYTRCPCCRFENSVLQRELDVKQTHTITYNKAPEPRKLRTLEENKIYCEERRQASFAVVTQTGVACPECGLELLSDGYLLMSHPPSVKTSCGNNHVYVIPY